VFLKKSALAPSQNPPRPPNLLAMEARSSLLEVDFLQKSPIRSCRAHSHVLFLALRFFW